MQTASTCRLKGQLRHTTAFTSTNRPRTSRISRSICTRAALDGPAIYAVTQQTIAYAAVVGAEAAFTGLNTKSDTPGRPAIPSTLAITGGTVVGTVLLNQGGGVGTAGCFLGVAVCGFALLTYGLRVRDTPYDPLDWPGAKTWPAVLALISFFALAAFSQGALDAFGKI